MNRFTDEQKSGMVREGRKVVNEVSTKSDATLFGNPDHARLMDCGE
jgi:hypothetical protein